MIERCDPLIYHFESAELPNYDNNALRYFVLAGPMGDPWPSYARETSQWLLDNHSNEWVFRELGYQAFEAHCDNLDLDMCGEETSGLFALELARAQREYFKNNEHRAREDIVSLQQRVETLNSDLYEANSAKRKAQGEEKFTSSTYMTGTQYMWREHDKYLSNLLVFLSTVSIGFPILFALLGTPRWVSGEPRSLLLSFDFTGAALLLFIVFSIVSVAAYRILRKRSHAKTQKRARQWHERHKHLLETE